MTIRALITAIAALFLATGTAHAEQKSTLPPECHFIKWRNMTKLYSCNGEIYDAAQVRAMRAKTKGRNR